MTGTHKYTPPPPPPDEAYEYTIRMTGAERIAIISLIRAGRHTTIAAPGASTRYPAGSYEAANMLLKILGVNP